MTNLNHDDNDQVKTFLNKLKIYYGRNDNIEGLVGEFFNKFQCDANTCDQLQQDVVDQILNENLFKTYKTNKKYKKKFLKTLINQFELLNSEVHSVMLNEYIELINENDDVEKNEEKKYYQFYYSYHNLNDPIILEQYEAVIANGTTGCHVWPAALKLIEFIEKNNYLFDNKSIIELGSGVGLVGLYCLKNVNLESYIFTDHHDLVLKQLEKNISLNYKNEATSTKLLKLLSLDWLEIDKCTLFDNGNYNFDLILASDVIFDPEVVPYLVKTIDYLLNKNENACAYISSAIRNEDTYNLFLHKLDDINLKHELIEEFEQYGERKSFSHIEIIKIFK